MKKLITFLTFQLIVFAMYGQDITGTWNGVLKVQGMQLRINFNIEKTDNGYQSTMDSPDQNAFGIPVESTILEEKTLTIKMPNLGAEYTGTVLSKDSITGTFTQLGQIIPLNLSKKAVKKEVLNRPQEPKDPRPYYRENIKFRNNKAAIELAGELTMPAKEGLYPAVILISGSGPQNRNEEVFGHKPFLVIADYLTRKGIAVLRFDDRGIAESEGDFKSATSFDFATDVEAAVAYLQTRKEIDGKKIGLIGHSEGGLIAPIVATQSNAVDFIVLLAGPGIPGAELLYMQSELIGRASGLDEQELATSLSINKSIYDQVVQSTDLDTFRADFKIYLKKLVQEHPEMLEKSGLSEDDFLNSLFSQIASPWMYTFLRYDPRPVLAKVKCPVLALNGAKDLQVPAEIDIKNIEKAVKDGGNDNITTAILPNLNHLFQDCDKGTPAEYSDIEETFSPKALALMADWIAKQVN